MVNIVKHISHFDKTFKKYLKTDINLPFAVKSSV